MATAALCWSLPAWADQITIGASDGTAYDFVSNGSGKLSGNSPGYYATALFGTDVGTTPPTEAHFGATTFTTGPQSNGVFSVVSGGAQALSFAFPDGDEATGTAQITQIDDDSPNPHIGFTWAYTSSGDAAFLAAFPGGMAEGDYTFDTLTGPLLTDFVTMPGDEFVTGSAGHVADSPSPVPEPATLAVLGMGLMMLGVWSAKRGRAHELAAYRF
jgi:hypothetical protein